MSLKIQKSEKNHNKIEYPYFYEADVALEFSEAYYRGSFGISKPQTVEITPNYKSDIGKTFYLGSFEKNKEIEFFIHVNNTGITYYSGKYNNASVVQLSSESWKIYFKDSEDIDRDFNDLIVKVSVDKIPEPEYRPSDPKINDINTGWCYPLKDLCSNFIKKLAFQNPFLILLIDFIELNKPEPARAVAAGWDCLYQNGLWRLTMA